MNSEFKPSKRDLFDIEVRNYAEVPSPKFQTLEEYRQGITELRSKGVSYRAIAQILSRVGVTVSKDTVARYCHAIVDKKRSRPVDRRKSPAIQPVEASPSPLNQTSLTPKAHPPDDKPRKRRGPRIADPKNI